MIAIVKDLYLILCISPVPSVNLGVSTYKYQLGHKLCL